MELGLTNKSVIVSGSSRGIGLAIARAFLSEGAKVLISGRDGDALDSARGSLAEDFPEDAIAAHSGDMADTDVIAAALATAEKSFGGVDAVVANIGNSEGSTGWDLTRTDWQDMINANLFDSSGKFFVVSYAF